MSFIILNSSRTIIFALSEEEYKDLRDPDIIQRTFTILKDLTEPTFSNKGLIAPLLASEEFRLSVRQAIIPLRHEDQLFGAMVMACPGDCGCNQKEIYSATLILNQAAGVIKRAVLHEEELIELQSRFDTHAEFSGILGKDPKMQTNYQLIEDIAPTDATVLIQGESGTGKELVAKAIHKYSSRKDKPFIVINCSAYPDTLLESELFGHEKGAFTGAIRQKPGRFEQGNSGTVFLDEIGEITSSSQIKLLRILQTQRFERLGGEKPLNVDVRIIAATNKDLLDQVKKGKFREDLFYRLNVIPIHMPPLREKRNDIPLLARHFLHYFAREQGKEIIDFSTESMRRLIEFDWPGNVRELENCVEHATVLAKGKLIEISDLPSVLRGSLTRKNAERDFSLDDHEKNLVQKVLEECSWNKKEASRRLGISRNTLYVKLKKYHIAQPTTH